METGDKQENWIKKLNEAEVDHSDAVWDGIELQLNKEDEVKRLRKTVLLYKWLAAACVVFALFSGVYNYLDNNSEIINGQQALTFQEDTNVNADLNLTQPETLLKPELNELAMDNTSLVKKSVVGKHWTSTNNQQSETSVAPSTMLASDPSLAYINDNKMSTLRMATNEYGKSLKEVLPAGQGGYNSVNKTAFFNQSNANEVKSPLVIDDKSTMATATLTEEEVEEEKENKKGAEQFWTTVGFAAGTFSNTTPTSPVATADALSNSYAAQTAADESNSSGYTYAVNLMVGTKVSQRWIIQGGMSYISQSSDYTATSVIADPVQQTLKAASINQFEKNADTNVKSNILTTNPYSVNNNIQLISFPMLAGFIVVDRKVGFQINSGFSTDLFLQNTITPQVENLEKTTQGRGDDSPYKAFNISGLIGTELSYRFGDHYRLALSPGVRYPFSSIYKTDLGVKSSPLTFDVAVRFKYILK